MTTNYDIDLIPQRVTAGLELLKRNDRNFEAVRHGVIDHGTFDMTDNCGCTLAAMFGTYTTGKEELNLASEHDAVETGFSGPISPASLVLADDPTTPYWDALQAEWEQRLGILVHPSTHRIITNR